MLTPASEGVETLVEGDAGPSKSEAAGPAPLAPGDRIGRYVIVDPVGKGGMGTVYRAYDPELDRRIAIKLLHERLSGGVGASRMLREAQAMAKISHPHVVAVHDVGTARGRVYIAMEFVDGQTVGRWLKADERSPSEVLDAFLQAGRGLVAAHALGLVHRDFKPENLMREASGRVRVMDFGLARTANQEPETLSPETEGSGERPTVSALNNNLTQMGALLGTPGYMAPEQFSGQRTDQRTDQFSFCVALWEGLFGERPFGGDTPAEMAAAVCNGEIAEPRAERQVRPAIRRALVRGLSSEPSDRWPSMRALLTELERDPRRGRRRVVGAVGGVALLAAGGGWFAWNEAQSVAACEAAGDRVRALWTDDEVTAAEAAVESSPLVYAEAAWARVGPEVSGYAEQLAQARVANCRARTVDDSIDPRDGALVSACLDDATRKLESLVDVLGGAADDAKISRLTTSATRLPSLERCDDPALLDRVIQLPDPLTRIRAEALRKPMSEADTLRAVGRLQAALDGFEDLTVAVESVGWPRLSANLHMDKGQVLREMGRIDEASVELRAAWREASVAGDDLTALHAAGQMAYIVGVERSRRDEAMVWADLAQVHIERLDIGDSTDVGNAYTIIGAVHASHDELDEARAMLEKAIGVYERAKGPDSPDLLPVLINIGTVESYAGHPDKQAAYLRRALDIGEQSYGPQHPILADVLNGLANHHESKGRTKEAEELFRRSLRVVESNHGPKHFKAVGGLDGLARLAQKRGDLQEALALNLRALGIVDETLGPDHHFAAVVSSNVAAVHDELGDHESAVTAIERSVAIMTKLHGADSDEAKPFQDALADLQKR